MKKMSINVNVLRTDIQKNTDYDIAPKGIGLAVFPNEVYDEKIDKQKYSKSIYNYRLRGVSTCSISETSENLTQTAIIEIPIKNTILKRDGTYKGKFNKGYLLFKNGVKLYEGNQIMIDMGYDDNLQTRFIGYITKFTENEPLITIEIEDSMYKLKNTISVKKNFNKYVELDTTDKLTPFNLTHLNQWLVQALYNWNKGINTDSNHPNTFVPKIRCYNTDLGKIVMRDAITPAEIYQYYFKDVYNMKVFFRNEYIAFDRDKENFNYLLEPVLYVGWSNWNLLPYNEIEIKSKKAIISDEQKFTENDINVYKRKYSETFKFMYPFNTLNSNGNRIDGYNPILDNNLEWYNTNKSNLKITASSFNSKNNEKITVTYQYGEYNLTQDNKQSPIKSDEIIAAMTDKEYSIYEKELKKQKILEEQRKTEEGNSGIIADSNNLEVYNEVSLNYPKYTQKELITKISEYFNTYPDSGLRGSFVVLGEPFVRQGDIVRLILDSSHIEGTLNIVSDLDDDNNEIGYVEYYIKSVNTTFDSSNGIRQELTIDKKVI